MQGHPAQQLNIIMPLPYCSPRGLPHGGKSLREYFFQGFPFQLAAFFFYLLDAFLRLLVLFGSLVLFTLPGSAGGVLARFI